MKTVEDLSQTGEGSGEDSGQSGIVAVIPCYNEERSIGSVVLKAKMYVDHVIVIDDGCTDKTSAIAERAGAVVIRHQHNQGKAAAANTAFDLMRKVGSRALVLLDGDGQHEPEDIPRLVAPILEGEADIVVGSRYMGRRTRIPRLRALGQRILTATTNLGAHTHITDSQSGYRAFSPRAVQMLTFSQKGFSMESEMQFLAQEAGLRMVEIPVTMDYYQQVKRSPFAHGMSVLTAVIGLISRRLPLVFFGIPGLAMLGVGLWEGWRVVEGYNQMNDFYVGPALLAVLFCTVGTLSLFTGLILYSIRSYIK